MGSVTTWTLVLPNKRPPLKPNDRMHWALRARLTREMRLTALVCAKRAGIPPLGRSAVTVTWFPPDARRRDANSLSAASKAWVDGLVDAGVWPDDDPAHVASETYRIGPMDRDDPRIEIEIRETL